MSVIIRLQNLPWSANAADIRAYFTALSIPEGGVHIVGGEQGDAFIAFSTDEDARQAMLRDGGKLKEVQIKLLLSSRTEMLRIIEQARQQTLNLQNIIQGNVTQPAAPVNQPIPNVAYETVESKDNMKEDDSDKGRDDDEYHRDRRDRRERDRSASRDRARSNEKDKSRDRDRERDRGRYNRDRDRDRRRRDRSKSRDRYRRRSRSRDRTRKTSRDKDSRNKRRDSEQDSDDKRATIEVPEPSTLQRWEPVLQSQSKPPLLPDPVLPQLLMQMQQGVKEMTPPIQPLIGFQDQDRRPMNFPQQMGQSMPYPGGPMRGRENWCGPMNNMSMPVMTSDGPAPRIPPNRHGLMPQNEMAMPKYSQAPYGMNQQFHPILKETNNHHWANQSMMQTNDDGESDICIEIRGLPLNATYVDVKRLFDGLTIPSDGIKMINDNQGNRTGIAYVKFSQQSHKKLALNQNGKKVRSSIVEVLHLREPIYNIAADNFKPEKDVMLKSDDMDIDNGDNSEEVAWKREGESIKVNYQDPRMINKSSKGSGKGNDSGRREQIKSDCVIIKGVHHSSTEADIIDFFSSLQIAPMEIYIVSDRMGQRVGDAFCKFMSPDEAEKALTKNKSTLGRHTVSVFSAPRDDMERAKSFCLEPHIPQYVPPPFMPVRGAYNPMQYKPRMPGEGMGNEYFMEGERPRMGFGNRFMMGDMERPPLMGRGDRPMMGRGRPMMPGMQNMRPPRRPPRSTSPYIDGDSLEHFGKPGCVVAMENIHFKADIDEIMEFFQGFKIEHEDVIRRFDESGRPTGDARVALKTPAEAMRAVRQLSFKTIRGRPIKVSIVQ